MQQHHPNLVAHGTGCSEQNLPVSKKTIQALQRAASPANNKKSCNNIKRLVLQQRPPTTQKTWVVLKMTQAKKKRTIRSAELNFAYTYGGTAMRSLVVICLWLSVSCKPLVRSPGSDLHAVSDGRVTLGVVASENAEGLQVYRLLVCRQQIDYSDAQVFANTSKCVSALVDDNGQEVVIFADGLRRPFAAKLANYGKIALGVALVAGAVFGGYSWFHHRTGGKFIKALTDDADEVYKMRRARVEKEHNVDMDKIKERLSAEFKKLGISDDGDLAEQMLLLTPQEIFDRVVSGKLASDADLQKIEAVFKQLDEEGFDVHNPIYAGGRFDKEQLDNFIQTVEGIDKSFADRLRAMQKLGRPISDSDVYYAAHRFQNSEKAFTQLMGDKLRKIEEGSMIVNEFSPSEQAALIKRTQNYEELLIVSKLRELEIQKVALRKTKKEGVDALEKDMKRLGMFRKNPRTGEQNNLHTITYDMDFSHKMPFFYRNFRQNYSNEELMVSINTDVLNKFLRSPKDGLDDYLLQARSYEELSELSPQEIKRDIEKFAYAHVGDRVATPLKIEKFGSEAAISEDIAKLSSLLLQRRVEETRFAWWFLREDKLWRKISMLNLAGDLRENDLLAISDEVANLANDISSSKGLAGAGMSKNLTSIIQRQQEQSLKRMQEALQLAKEGRDAEVTLAVKLAKEKQQKGLLITVFSSGAAVGVLASLDKSIWSHGEKLLGDRWSQIFNEHASFTDATAVEDIGAVLDKLAEIFGYKVNAAAVQLGR